jgi:prepilin-type N-terminal cleavage/methylation domain-containing protein
MTVPTPHRRRNDSGFTMLELIVVVAAIAILAAILTPMVLKLIDDSRVSRAENEVEAIATAVSALYKDTARWPYTNANGPSGTAVSRLVSSANVVKTAATGAGSGAASWGTYGTAKQLGDFLYWNNPDNDSNANGSNANQTNADYATSGPGAWKGPYLESYSVDDPWGHAYVINVRYLPGGGYAGTQRHKVMVISAGPDGLWSTPFSDGVTETVMGDDIAHVIHVTN